jgi:hypothetical protein
VEHRVANQATWVLLQAKACRAAIRDVVVAVVQEILIVVAAKEVILDHAVDRVVCNPLFKT